MSYADDYPEHARTSCSDSNPCNADPEGTGCARCNAIVMDRSASEFKRGRDEGFCNAICYVLGYLNGVGDCNSTYYTEILESTGKDEVIAYARSQNEMKFTGLDRYLRIEKQNARLSEKTP